jgi:hypothetical protein
MNVIKHSLISALLVLSLLATGVSGSAGRIEITEIKNVGVSAARETHSIIQVSWTAQTTSDSRIVSFELQLEVTYADGKVEPLQAKAGGSARSTRFEVPTLHRGAGRPAAEMRSFKVSITTNYSETATKQGSP